MHIGNKMISYFQFKGQTIFEKATIDMDFSSHGSLGKMQR